MKNTTRINPVVNTPYKTSSVLNVRSNDDEAFNASSILHSALANIFGGAKGHDDGSTNRVSKTIYSFGEGVITKEENSPKSMFADPYYDYKVINPNFNGTLSVSSGKEYNDDISVIWYEYTCPISNKKIEKKLEFNIEKMPNDIESLSRDIDKMESILRRAFTHAECYGP